MDSIINYAIIIAAAVVLAGFPIWAVTNCWRDKDRSERSKINWTILIFLTGVIGAIGYVFSSKRRQPIKNSVTVGIIFVVVMLVGFMVVMRSVTTIEPEYLGIQKVFGEISDKTLQPGIHFKNPLSTLIKVPVRMVFSSEHKIKGVDKTGSEIDVFIAYEHRVNEEKALDVYRETRWGYEKKWVLPEIKSYLSQIDMKGFQPTKSKELEVNILNHLNSRLNQNGVIIEKFEIRK